MLDVIGFSLKEAIRAMGA